MTAATAPVWPSAPSAIAPEAIAAAIGMNRTMPLIDLCDALALPRTTASAERLFALVPLASAGRLEIDRSAQKLRRLFVWRVLNEDVNTASETFRCIEEP
jgi:hypothetical protein